MIRFHACREKGGNWECQSDGWRRIERLVGDRMVAYFAPCQCLKAWWERRRK